MSRYGLIRLALASLSATRAHRILPAASDAAGVVVTLHHVRPKTGAAFQPNALLEVTPEFLDRFISRFKSQGWRFVSVDELVSGADPAGGKRIALTLDDGYRNNAEHALPVFRKHAAPFTIYVCPGFCDRSAELWWEALERIIAEADSVPCPGAGATGSLSTRTTAEKMQAFRVWTEWLTTQADEIEQRQAIRALADQFGLDLAALARELVMDWDEIRAIAADPLCTIGAHTLTHPALARLPPQLAFREMQGSADRIEAEIGVCPTSMAFPYGYAAAAGAREASLAEQAGFAASFTTRPGYVPCSGRTQGLPRISLNGMFQNLGYLEVLLTPALWKLKDNLRKRA